MNSSEFAFGIVDHITRDESIGFNRLVTRNIKPFSTLLATVLFLTTLGIDSSHAAKSTEDGDATEWIELIEGLQEQVPDQDDPLPPPPWPDVTPMELPWKRHVVDCANTSCTSNDQRLIRGNRMYDHKNFDVVVDRFGREREFYVHLPARYDSVDGINEQIPVIFAFHGRDQTWDKMVDGKWDEYFERDVAFVIPQGNPDPCDDQVGATIWMQPSARAPGSTPNGANCHPDTQVFDVYGNQMTYWNASLSDTFVDVSFVEELRSMILNRFPKLNPNKVYATGFSSGAGFTFTLLCYRSSLFRGFSSVASSLTNDSARGDYNADGVEQTDPNSLSATCGKTILSSLEATGINSPDPWGEYSALAVAAVDPRSGIDAVEYRERTTTRIATKPVAYFVGDHDHARSMVGYNQSIEIDAAVTLQTIVDTTTYIRERNNLSGLCTVIDPYHDVAQDDAQTQRCRFSNAASDAAQQHSEFRRYLVRGDEASGSGTHAMPDADECGRAAGYFMTCDYNYTDETLTFFENQADLNLDP